MSNVFGSLFDFRSKDDKKRDYDAYSKRIFPYGDAQKEKIASILLELLPKEKEKYLMLHYVLVKQGLTSDNPMDYETSAKKIEKRKLVRLTPDFKAQIHALMDIDLAIDETLAYPSLEELKNIARNYIS